MNRLIPAREPLIRVLGRTVLRDPLPLFWTASGIEFITDGTTAVLELEADFSQYEQWIRVELDGAQLLRMPLNRGVNRVTLYRGCEAGKPRRIRLYKEVQAMPGDPDASLLVRAVETDGQLLPLPEYAHRIEFVGDSITSGEGLACGREFMDWVSCMFSTEGEYGVDIARELNADARIISQSGWGYYSSWDNDPACALPLVYESVCGPLKGEKNAALGAAEPWDFGSWKPEVIVVNLGTNDEGSFGNPPHTDADGTQHKQSRGADGHYDAPSEERLRGAVRGFLHMLRRDNPDAWILLAFGIYPGTMPGEMQALLGDELARFRRETGDTRCGYAELPPITEDRYGSRGHPGRLCHADTARVLTERIRAILDGKKNA